MDLTPNWSTSRFKSISIFSISCAKTHCVEKELSCLLMAIPQLLTVTLDLKQAAVNLTRIRTRCSSGSKPAAIKISPSKVSENMIVLRT